MMTMHEDNMYRTILSEDVQAPTLRQDLTTGKHEAAKAEPVKASRLSRREQLIENAWQAYVARRQRNELVLLKVA